MLESILREGLTLGRVSCLEKEIPRLRTGFQWLTSNPERDRQEWCNPAFSHLPYIPRHKEINLSPWSDCGPLMVPPDQLRILNQFGNPAEYHLYRGPLPPEWIVAVDRLGARWTGRRAHHA